MVKVSYISVFNPFLHKDDVWQPLLFPQPGEPNIWFHVLPGLLFKYRHLWYPHKQLQHIFKVQKEKKRIFLFHTQLLWHSGIYCDACLPSYFILFIPRWFTWSLWSQRNTQFMLGASFSSRNHRKRVLMSSLDMSLYSSIKTRFDDHWNRFQVFPGVARVSCIGRDHPH